MTEELDGASTTNPEAVGIARAAEVARRELGLDETEGNLSYRDAELDSLRNRHYVELAPSLAGIINDPDRDNIITSFVAKSVLYDKTMIGVETYNYTEHEGLLGLSNFLSSFISAASIEIQRLEERDKQETKAYSRLSELIIKAKVMIESLTFIGNKEYQSAISTIGQRWVDFIKEDPSNVICALTQWSSDAKIKSDAYLLDSVICGLSENDRKLLDGRVFNRIDDLPDSINPEDIRVVLLDDWIIGGKQLHEQLYWNYQLLEKRGLLGSVEVNNIVAHKDRIENGFTADIELPDGRTIDYNIPIFAHFMARSDAINEGKSPITGSHCPVDIGYEIDISEMVDVYYEITTRGSTDLFSRITSKRMPPLTAIQRPYRNGKYIPRFSINSVGGIYDKQKVTEDLWRRRELITY